MDDWYVSIVAWQNKKDRREAKAQFDSHVQLVELLAAIEHTQWSEWQKHVHDISTRNEDGSITIPADKVARWERQINTAYEDLSEQEKQSDRDQVYRYLHLIERR